MIITLLERISTALQAIYEKLVARSNRLEAFPGNGLY